MARPFIKYLGGKRGHKVLEHLKVALSKPTDTYLAVMAGGGGDFFTLQEAGHLEGCTVILNDADVELVQLYTALQTYPHRTHKVAQSEVDVVTGQSQASAGRYYNDVRELWNAGGQRHQGTQLFLRHAAFNGLFRRNLSGEMNVPPRDLNRLTIPSLSDLVECAEALKGVELLDWDFRRIEEDEDLFVGPGTLIYLDPPYDGGFTEYIAGGFKDQDQHDVVVLAAEWARRGASVVYSNAATPLIRALLSEHWPEATVELTDVRRPVSSDGATRGAVPEVIAYVY